MRYRNIEKLCANHCYMCYKGIQNSKNRIVLRLCIMYRAILFLSCYLTVARAHIETKSPVYNVCLSTYLTF